MVSLEFVLIWNLLSHPVLSSSLAFMKIIPVRLNEDLWTHYICSWSSSVIIFWSLCEYIFYSVEKSTCIILFTNYITVCCFKMATISLVITAAYPTPPAENVRIPPIHPLGYISAFHCTEPRFQVGPQISRRWFVKMHIYTVKE